MLRKILDFDYLLLDLAKELDKVTEKYNAYNFVITDDGDDIYFKDISNWFSSDSSDFSDCLNAITSSFRKIIKDKNLYIDFQDITKLRIVSEKFDLLLKKDREKIALKSGDYFALIEKGQVPFLNELEKTNQVISKDNKDYFIYEASSLELDKKINEFIDNDALWDEIDKYSLDKNLNI